MSTTRNVTLSGNEYTIQRSSVFGSVSFSAWEKTAVDPKTGYGHSTITTFDGVWFGLVGTVRLPKHLDALKAMSDERIIAVGAWHEQEYQRAYAAIVAAFPDAAVGHRSLGHITI